LENREKLKMQSNLNKMSVPQVPAGGATSGGVRWRDKRKGTACEQQQTIDMYVCMCIVRPKLQSITQCEVWFGPNGWVKKGLVGWKGAEKVGATSPCQAVIVM